MNVAICIIVALVAGYVIGVLQGGIHIYTGEKPVAPKKKNEEQEYNKDFSHMLPPEMQQYFQKNNGYMK